MKILLLIFGTIGLYSSSTLFIKAYQVLTGPGRFQTSLMNVVSGCSAFVFLICLKGFSFHYTVFTLLLAVLFGTVYWVYCSVKVTAAGIGPMAVLSMSYVLGGILLPSLYGIILLNEPASANKFITILLVMLSFVPLIVTQKKSLAFSPKFLACCALLFTLNGLLSIVMKAAQSSSEPQFATDFVGLYYFFYFVTSLVMLGLRCRHVTTDDMRTAFSARSFLYMALIGLLNALGGICNYQLGFHLQASIQFPLTQSSMLVAITVLSMFMYREKPNKATILSLATALLAIVMISV